MSVVVFIVMALNDMLDNESGVQNPRVLMWCVPRSVSTAFTKCLSFVEGAEIWHEPYVISKAIEDMFNFYHLNESDDVARFPLTIEGNETLYREYAEKLTLGGDVDSYRLDLLSPHALKNIFDSLNPAKKFIFIKDMAVGMPPSRYEFLPDKSSRFRHFFLIRHPVKVYKSFRKSLLDHLLCLDDKFFKDVPFDRPDPKTFHCIAHLPQPKEGTPYFFKSIHMLWKYIRKTVDEDPIVLDIDELLEEPAAMLPVLCRGLGIPYSEDLLSWDASSDVVLKWQSSCPNVREAPRYAMWFSKAFNSTCFERSSTTTSLDDEDATPDIKEIAELEIPYYEEMFKTRITL